MTRSGPTLVALALALAGGCGESEPGDDGAETTGSSSTTVSPTSTPASSATSEDETGSGDSTTDASETGTSETTGDPPGCPPFEPGADAKLDGTLAVLAGLVSPAPNVDLPSGVSLAIVYDGQLLSAAGVGMQGKTGHPREDLAVDAETAFWIASTSKLVTAAGAMTLVDDGSLDVHESVITYLPDYTETNGQHAAITMHDLMRMSAGLANDGGCWIFSVSASEEPVGCAWFTEGPGTVLEQMFDPETLATPPYDGSLGVYNITNVGMPGSAPFFYSNWGTMLAGRVMEVAAADEFTALMAARIFEPAEMCTATYDGAVTIATDNYAIGAGANPVDGQCPEPEIGHDSTAPFFMDELACPGRNPNGGVRASAIDMGRFARAILGDLAGANVMLSQQAIEQVLCPDGGAPNGQCDGRVDSEGHFAGVDYGYFNFSHVYQGHRVYTHGGGRAGFGSLFWVIPSQRFAIAILGNHATTLTSTEPAAQYAVSCYLDDQC